MLNKRGFFMLTDSLLLHMQKPAREVSYPLVARELVNRSYTIATAFSREAWTSNDNCLRKNHRRRLPNPKGRKAAFVTATLLPITAR